MTLMFGILLFTGLVVMASGFVWCIKHDLPHLYLKARRIAAGLMTALALASTLIYIFVAMWSCNSAEPYSLAWYVMWCMGHSS